MARQCNFCRRWFKNKQAVRRHLGFCIQWKIAKAGGQRSLADGLNGMLGMMFEVAPKRRLDHWKCTGCGAKYDGARESLVGTAFDEEGKCLFQGCEGQVLKVR
jgi:hypothetical protein